MSEPAATYEGGQLPWRKLEVAVFKLQKRIYRASQANDVRRVHKLQRLLLKSRAAKYLAVRRVMQDNHGKLTAGVDGITALTPAQRQQVVERFDTLPTGQPARRVWIPKAGTTELRPLSIPTLSDRAQQALVKQVLEPEWEAKFEPNSYGFRPGRSVHDAIGAIFSAIKTQPKYCLDADLAKCFDRIEQAALLRKLQPFPQLSRPIRRWLKAGVLDNGVFTATETGTGQGSLLSPLLANVALHGIEDHIRSHFPTRTYFGPPGGRYAVNWKPQLIKYAEDVRHITWRQIPFTERRGSEDKTFGSTTYLEAKAEGDSSMSLKRRASEGVYGAALQDPRDTVRATLPKPQFPAMEAYIPCRQRLLAGSPR
jgi:RNA-directed DNA polymerase